MTVFLRWGAFALLSIAALIYAYRVNERSDDIRAKIEQQVMAQRAAETARQQSAPAPVSAGNVASTRALSPACEEAVQLAMEAARARRSGEPLDRVLRQGRIAWEEDPARKRQLTAAAQLGYTLRDVAEPEIRVVVAKDCAE